MFLLSFAGLPRKPQFLASFYGKLAGAASALPVCVSKQRRTHRKNIFIMIHLLLSPSQPLAPFFWGFVKRPTSPMLRAKRYKP